MCSRKNIETYLMVIRAVPDPIRWLEIVSNT